MGQEGPGGRRGIGAGYPAQVQAEAQNIGDLLKLLAPLRTAATTTQLPAHAGADPVRDR